MKSESLDRVFKALAHASRRRILDLVKQRPGLNVRELCRHFEVSRIAVLRHVNVLEEAELIVSEREWRERHLYLNVVPIQLIYDRWTSDYSALWAAGIAHLKYAVETGEGVP